MTGKRKAYKTFTREFKLEAVRLMKTSDRSPSELVLELGIRRNQLYKWKEQLADKDDVAFTRSKGRPKKEDQSAMTHLKQENARLREEKRIYPVVRLCKVLGVSLYRNILQPKTKTLAFGLS